MYDYVVSPELFWPVYNFLCGYVMHRPYENNILVRQVAPNKVVRKWLEENHIEKIQTDKKN